MDIAMLQKFSAAGLIILVSFVVVIYLLISALHMNHFQKDLFLPGKIILITALATIVTLGLSYFLFPV